MATDANLESCSVGEQKGELYHKIIYCRVQELKTGDEVRADDIRLIEWKTKISNLKTICLHHVKKILNKIQIVTKSFLQSIPSSYKSFFK